MVIGSRLRLLRKEGKLSQGDIEKRTGLLGCYISRLENGHTVPSIQTLEKLARALEVPLYQLFCDNKDPPKMPDLLKRKTSDAMAWDGAGKDARYLHKLRQCLSQTEEPDRRLLMVLAQKMAAKRHRRDRATG